MSVITEGTRRRMECIAPVEAFIGKFDKKAKTANTRYGGSGFVVGFQRATGAANRFSYRVKGLGKASQEQTQLRAKFKAVSQSARERLLDPSKRQQDEKNFKKQTKYGTLWGYVFMQEWNTFEG